VKELWDERYLPTDHEIVKKKARKMSGPRGYRDCELADIEQELAMKVFQEIHRQRSDRGSRAGFVGKVAKNALLNLIEKRSAKKRDDRRNIEYDDGPEGTLLDGETTPEQIDHELDVEEMKNRMPPDLRQVLELRMAGHSDRELEDLLSLTRGKVRTLSQRLEQFGKEEGLDTLDED
jgi:RNA polymerase sigma factor (sigma-70 family)